jgi:outer membrane protein assembly factor BamA
VWPDAARTDLRVAGTVRDWRALQPDLQLEGTADLALQVQGPVDALTARGRVNIENASYAGVGLGAVMADIQGDANVLAIDLTSPELNTRATAKVTLAGDRRAAVEVHVDNADLARLTRDAGAPVALTGRVSLTARGEGPLDDWRRGTADLDLTALDARVGDLPVRLASPGRATYRNETVDVESLEAQLGDTRLSIAGRLPTGASPIGVAPADALRALLVGDMQQVIAALQASGLTDVPDVSARGPIALLARVTGTAERPTVAADLDVGASEIAFGKLPPARIDEARVTVANGWIERLVASGRWQESRVSLEGRAPLHIFRDYLPRAVLDALPGASGTATLDARAQSITPGVLTPFVDPEAVSQIAGVVDASAHLEANSLDLADVRGEVRLDRLDVRVAGLPVTQREPTRIAIGDGVARVVSWDWTGQGATFNVQGEIGLTNQQAALLGAGVVDLRLLAPFVRTAGVGLAGTLAPRFSVSGSLADPRIDGEMSLTDGEIRLAEPRVIATDVEAFAVLSPEQARITTLTGVVNGGTLTGAGEVQYARGQPPSARLSGTIRGMGLDFPEGLRSELNADLAVTLVNEGEQASGRVTGTVTVVRSAYREPIAVAAGLLTALRTERAVVAQADPDALASRLALDVRVVTDSDIIVDNNLARLQLGGDLRVIGTAAAPALAGRAVVREGGQLFLGTNVYRLEDSGAIDFSDSDAIVPDFNLRATTRAGGQRIEVTITGTPENPDLRYFAPESELSQADIASLLLTGRTLSQVSGAEADIVREQVIGLLSGDVLGLASRRVGLDTLRLGGPDASTLRRDAAAVAGETDPTSRMTFGKLIRDNIELTYSQSLRDGDAQTWIVDYRPLTQANVRFVSDDENLRTYEFRHDVSIGGSRTARQERSDQPVRPERIVDVTVNVDRGLQPEALERALTLEQGDVFDFGEWQRDRDRLEELLYEQGRFEARVTAQRLERENGIALVYAIAAGPTTSLDVTGYSLAARAREAIERAWTQSIFDDFLREEAEGIVRGALADDGYLEPRVTSTLETGETKTLHLAVEPGTRTRERRIDIEAGDETLERELDLLVQQRGLVSAWNAPEELRSALINELRARGYLAAEVRTNPPRIESGVAVLPVTIDAGPQFVIEEVTFTGANRIAIDRLREAASLDRGDPYIPAELEAARRRVDVAYRREGFVTTRVTAQPGVDRGSQRVSIAFTIEEGPQQRLREITVSGNRGIDTDVITRAIDLAVGDPIGADAWLEARARLFDTGLFRRVDVTAEPLESAAEGSERPTRLNVVVEEWPALRVRYGLQVSEERPEESVEGRDLTPGLSADVTRRTLFGRAVGVGAAVEYQRRERQARVFMNAPTLFGWPIESLLSAERSHREFAASESATDTSSIAWEQRVGLGRRLQLSYSYRFDRDHTFETRPDDDPLNPIFDITVNVARLTAAGVLDTRDDPTEPSRGLFLSGNVELAPQSLGSDVSFVRELGQAYYFRPWHRVVFASAGRFGVVSPRGGQTLLPSELFLAGGARTVRGVAEEDLGPRDFFGPTGGRALLVLNQEVRFPLFKWVRGVGFFDAGNVFPEPRDIAFGRLVTGVGAGLRVTTPFALLRIDYGRLWTNKGDLRSSEWTFGIGHAF